MYVLSAGSDVPFFAGAEGFPANASSLDLFMLSSRLLDVFFSPTRSPGNDRALARN